MPDWFPLLVAGVMLLARAPQPPPQIPIVAPSSSPTVLPFPYHTPYPLGKTVAQEISDLQNQVSALQTQTGQLQSEISQLQSTVASQQKSMTALRLQLSFFQQQYQSHTHLYFDAGTAMGITTIPLITCTHNGPVEGNCFTGSTLTVMNYKQSARLVPTSVPTSGP